MGRDGRWEGISSRIIYLWQIHAETNTICNAVILQLKINFKKQCLLSAPWPAFSLHHILGKSPILSFMFCIIIFYWSIIALYGCTVKRINYMYTYIPFLLDLSPIPSGSCSHLDHHRASNWAPCAIPQVYTSYLFYTWCYIYVKPNPPVHGILHCVHTTALYIRILHAYTCAGDYG